MDLLDIKISEIKNINLIYLYDTDSIFTNKDNVYVGLKVVYNNHHDYISLDYKDAHFPYFVKKTIDRYKQEKDNRRIILLGNLTNKMMSDEKILQVSEEKRTYNDKGLTLFSTTQDKVVSFYPYLKEILVSILKLIKHYEVVQIMNINGYNHKYQVEYMIGNVKKTFPILLMYEDDENMQFRIGSIDGTICSISGNINNTINRIFSEWKSNHLGLTGTYYYNVITNETEKKIFDKEKSVFYDDKVDTLIDEDKLLIDYYMKLFGVNIQNDNILKISDYNYIFGYEQNLLEEEDNIFVQNHGIQLNISDDKVSLKYKIRNGLSKYNDMLNIDLDFDLFEVIITKINNKNDYYLLIEKTNSNNYGKKYSYEVYPINDFNFKKPIDITAEKIEINKDVSSLYDIKKLIKNSKGE